MINKEGLKKVIEGTSAERRYLCEKSFELFFLYYYVDYLKFPFAPFHFSMFEDIHNLLDGKYRELAWIMFRESAKTSISKALLVYLICYNKKRYINVDSYDKENAERILFDIVIELQSNPRLKTDFGELFNLKRENTEATQKRINNFITNNGVRVEAHSTQESVRGRIHGHQRPDFLLLDDFETNKTKDSEAMTLQIKKHISEFASGLDSTAKILYLGNYITEHGNIAELRKRAEYDDRLMFRQVDVIENGKPTWPSKYVMFDKELLDTENIGKVSLEDKKKQLGSQVFNAEMMNQPIDEDSQEFFKKHMKPITMSEVNKMVTRKFVTIDTAMSKGSKSDSTGITKNYVNEQNRWHIKSQKYRINSKQLIDLIFQFHEDGFEKIGIETTAYTEGIEPFFQEECRKRNKYPYVVQLKHGGVMKETRIRGLIPRYEAGDIYHIEGFCDDVENEALRFPNSEHDDCLDSLAYQLQIAEKPFKVVEKIEEVRPQFSDIGV